jgi:4-hydroxybenzoate polyprenyltransferase
MGGVILILVYAYWNPLVQLREVDVFLFEGVVNRFVMLTFFAVFSNLSREMVKDIEDVDADRFNHCESTAVKLGIQKVATLNVILSIVLSVVMAIPFAFYLTSFWLSGIYVLLVLFPTISSWYLWYSARSDAARKVSTGLKIYMIAGLIFLLLLPL